MIAKISFKKKKNGAKKKTKKREENIRKLLKKTLLSFAFESENQIVGV